MSSPHHRPRTSLIVISALSRSPEIPRNVRSGKNAYSPDPPSVIASTGCVCAAARNNSTVMQAVKPDAGSGVTVTAEAGVDKGTAVATGETCTSAPPEQATIKPTERIMMALNKGKAPSWRVRDSCYRDTCLIEPLRGREEPAPQPSPLRGSRSIGVSVAGASYQTVTPPSADTAAGSRQLQAARPPSLATSERTALLVGPRSTFTPRARRPPALRDETSGRRRYPGRSCRAALPRETALLRCLRVQARTLRARPCRGKRDQGRAPR